MRIEKNNVPFLQFREKILDISELEKKYNLLLPPIFKSFITVFEPCFYSLKAKLNSKKDHGEAGGFLLGIGPDNRDKIYYSNFTKPYIFYAENIYELIAKFEKVNFDYFNEIEDPNSLYMNLGENFWRVREDIYDD